MSELELHTAKSEIIWFNDEAISRGDTLILSSGSRYFIFEVSETGNKDGFGREMADLLCRDAEGKAVRLSLMREENGLSRLTIVGDSGGLRIVRCES